MHAQPAAEIPQALRREYLNGLPAAQEYYLEQLVQAGSCWILSQRSAAVGYAVVHDRALVEFYLTLPAQHHAPELLETAMQASGAQRILCKSFDTLLLHAATDGSARMESVGLLFRQITDPTCKLPPDLRMRPAATDEWQAVAAINDDFFDSDAEIQGLIQRGQLFLLERQQEMLGCGIGQPVIEGAPHWDIGMLVAAAHRQQGYGACIISWLKQHHLQRGLQPICGCSSDNTASARALYNAGFSCTHRLLDITRDQAS